MSTMTANPSFDATECPLDAEIVPDDTSSTGLLELLLKQPARVDALLRDPAHQREAVPRLLALALAGFAIYGLAATVVLNALLETTGYWPTGVPAAHWSDHSAANLLAAYCLGLVAANGVCLPSFYFYGLLAGVRTTMLGVTAHAMKGLAASALALVGILPLYVSLALAAIVFPVPETLLTVTTALGLALPFIAGSPLAESEAEPLDRRGQSERARRQNLARLRDVRCRAYDDLMGTLAWVRELVSMIHLAKFTGAPASRAEELVAQIAAAVEGVSAVTWQEERREEGAEMRG